MRKRWQRLVSIVAASAMIAGLPGMALREVRADMPDGTGDAAEQETEEISAAIPVGDPETDAADTDADVSDVVDGDMTDIVEGGSAEDQDAEDAVVNTASADADGESYIVIEENGTAAERDTEVQLSSCAEGQTVTGTFPSIDGYEIASIRYIIPEDQQLSTASAAGSGQEVSYDFAEFVFNEASGLYEYSFQAPADNYQITEAQEIIRGDAAPAEATVIAEYYDLSVWDGAVDVSWYNETEETFTIHTPAQLAGLAAIVNGSVDASCEDYMIRGDAESYITCEVEEEGSLPAGGTGLLHKGVAAHDFANRTVILDADLDMGGADGAEIIHTNADGTDWNSSENRYDYPNWMPIGGEYLTDVSDISTMIQAHFNGTIEGNGHRIENIYCYRWAYPNASVNAVYSYAQGTGFIGMMGVLYDNEAEPSVAPAVRNLSVSGYIYGRRMVGGVVGDIGGGSNSISNSSAALGVRIENVANHAWVYNTDSKGIGGIVGCNMARGSLINCYNDGNISTIYANPAGGIIGANEQMDIYCCYNRGSVSTGSARFGRGIGGTGNSPEGFVVSDCYYLNGCGDDPDYPGYYTRGLPDSCSVTVTGMTKAQMTGGSLLKALNVNGSAYCQDSDGWPVLRWETGPVGEGSLTLQAPEGGSISADSSGVLPNGTVVYLTNTADTGYNFRYYTANGSTLTGAYVTVYGDQILSAYIESAKAGTLKLPVSSLVDISVTKTGQISVDGELQTVTDHPVAPGDELYENDILTVKATLKADVSPEDPNLDYKAAVGMSNAYTYYFTYTGEDRTEQASRIFTVDSRISREGISLAVEAVPLTTEKLWTSLADTSWYDLEQDSFILTDAAQLAGLDALVEDGCSFAGQTVKLGNDISLKNTDGTEGIRYWNGIGSGGTEAYFAGTFDGQGHRITDYTGLQYGLFAQCKGSSGQPAVIRNVTVCGSGSGSQASGIVGTASYTTVSDCQSYVEITEGSSYVGGIAGTLNTGCSLTACCNYASVNAVNSAGGIVGNLAKNASVADCINTGNVTVLTTTNNMVGGVAGMCSGSLERCANYGDVLASGRNIGGVAGQAANGAALTDCCNAGTVTYEAGINAGTDTLGGIIGYGLLYSMRNCFNVGVVIRRSGAMTANIGSAVGKDTRNSKSALENVYVLAGTEEQERVSNSATLEELKTLSSSYYAGLQEAGGTAFASAEKAGVLAAINEDGCFSLQGKGYPELNMVSGIHQHTGGCADCTERAVCDTCGVSYGNTDPDRHTETEVRDAVPVIWLEDGYTGDTWCTACGTKLTDGQTIPADPDEEALQLTVLDSRGQTVADQTYSRKDFDDLKTTGLIGYMYGAKNQNMVAATEYVTIDALLEDLDLTGTQVKEISVLCSGSSSTLSMETLEECSFFYDEEGNARTVPAAICIAYGSWNGSLSDAAEACRTMNDLRFGYGISQQQYADKTEVGGKRCVSPVEQVTIRLNENGPLLGDADGDGTVSASDITAIVRYVKGIDAEFVSALAERNADTNRDGRVDQEDATHLARYLARAIRSL